LVCPGLLVRAMMDLIGAALQGREKRECQEKSHTELRNSIC
jgi:hypothetical protein